MPFLDQITRLVYYGNELGRICHEVSVELDLNRQRRSEWYHFTRTWKRAWLADEVSLPTSVRNEMRGQVSVLSRPGFRERTIVTENPDRME